MIRTIGRTVDRIKVTTDDKKEYYEGFNDDPKFQATLRKHVTFPRHKPYFYDIFTDHEGHVLVETSDVVDKEPLHDVFTPEGDFIGQIRLPDLKNVRFHDGAMYRVKFSDEVMPAVIRFVPREVDTSG